MTASALPSRALGAALLLAGVLHGCGAPRAVQAPPPPAPPPPEVHPPFHFADDFAQRYVGPAYAVERSPHLAITQVDGLLRMAGKSPVPLAEGRLDVKTPLRAGPGAALVASVRIRLGGGGDLDASMARIQLVGDGGAWVNFGMVAGTGVVHQRRASASEPLTQTVVLDRKVDDLWHRYAVAYDGAVARLSFDGRPVAEVPIALASPRVWLQAYTRSDRAGSLLAELDDLAIEEGQAPSRLEAPPVRVLVVTPNPSEAGPLADALWAAGMTVHVELPKGFPVTLGGLEPYDFVIVSDTPADALPGQAQGLLVDYVRELGGGLLFAAGERGWSSGPLERVLPVYMRLVRPDPPPVSSRSVALEIVVDRSQRMRGRWLEAEKRAIAEVLRGLGPNDRIGVVAGDESPVRVVPIRPARPTAAITTAVAGLQVRPGRNLLHALDDAYQDLSVTPASMKLVVALVGGPAPMAGLHELSTTMAAEGISVSTFGLGEDVDEQQLELIADTSGGRFVAAHDPVQLPQDLAALVHREVHPPAPGPSTFSVRMASHPTFLRSLDLATAPPLQGELFASKRTNAEALLSNQHGDTLLARWQVGRGWALAFSIDAEKRWLAPWLDWPGWGLFWTELVTEHARARKDLQTPK